MSKPLEIIVPKWQAGLREMARYKTDTAKLLRQQAKLAVLDMVKFTPPFSDATLNEKGHAGARRVGLEAVARDVQRVFKPLDTIRALDDPPRGIAKAIKKKDWKAVEPFVQNVLENKAARIFQEADPAMHQRFRNRRGGITAKKLSFFVANTGSIKRLIKKKQDHVGKAKDGWSKAASALGLNLPNWITKHGSPGSVKDKSDAKLFQHIDVANLVPYIQAAGADLRIVSRALQNRARNMAKELEHLIAARARRAERAAARKV